MSFSRRLVEERKRLKFKQKEISERLGIHINSQLDYEKERLPSFAVYLERLADLGFDIGYIVTGARQGVVLTAEECEVLALYRKAPETIQTAAKAVLASGHHATQGPIVNGNVAGPVATNYYGGGNDYVAKN